jgi:hypothetical protein
MFIRDAILEKDAFLKLLTLSTLNQRCLSIFVAQILLKGIFFDIIKSLLYLLPRYLQQLDLFIAMVLKLGLVTFIIFIFQ